MVFLEFRENSRFAPGTGVVTLDGQSAAVIVPPGAIPAGKLAPEEAGFPGDVDPSREHGILRGERIWSRARASPFHPASPVRPRGRFDTMGLEDTNRMWILMLVWLAVVGRMVGAVRRGCRRAPGARPLKRRTIRPSQSSKGIVSSRMMGHGETQAEELRSRSRRRWPAAWQGRPASTGSLARGVAARGNPQ